MNGNPRVKSNTYRWASEQTRQPVKMLLKYIVNKLCIKAVGNFGVRKIAQQEAFPCLLKGIHFQDGGVLNNTVTHTMKVRKSRVYIG